ncbi:hypothetical protein HMPREF1544_04205 [Mucor circinelloides 1006PhL]|uniref:Zn(2)-C6 fungal-type domain-containing protein n=1 Tax=Mucor circinelloides f. circinelloides (strain 1006PhL) TaxID=1220926 RepID=S2K9K7_MUCC1|nr:hypothetical protein HMPREF1544_04205 [Mucor circinelloides 1006PhL]
MTRMHPSMKRPRAPIACYRCHHKKVRCDGEHPNCTRCLTTGVLCAYPSSRRSRNTQPTNVDPFIDNLSQLEARIRRIETDLESQRALVRSVCTNDSLMGGDITAKNNNSTLTSRMLKTEKDLQESRSIVAQLRLRGEQRAARGRRAAAAAAAASVASSTTPGPDKNNGSSGKLQKSSNEAVNGTGGKQRANHSSKLKSNNLKKERPYTPTSAISTSTATSSTSAALNNLSYTTAMTSPPFYFTSTSTTSPTDFINPSPTYYFPSYTTDLTSSMCSNNNTTDVSSHPLQHQQQQQFNFQDWPLLNDLPHTSAANTTSSSTANDFVDPMIIAAAEAHQNGIAPPMLSVSSYMVDEETSIMAARARSLSHLPTAASAATDANMLIPGLQPSSSSTSTSSNSSFGFNTNQSLYENYSQFMDSNDMMLIDGVGVGTAQTASLR